MPYWSFAVTVRENGVPTLGVEVEGAIEKDWSGFGPTVRSVVTLACVNVSVTGEGDRLGVAEGDVGRGEAVRVWRSIQRQGAKVAQFGARPFGETFGPEKLRHSGPELVVITGTGVLN